MGTIYNNIPSNAPTDNVYLNSLIIGGSWTPSVGTGANLTWSTSAGKIYQDVNAYGSAWLLYETNALKAALQTWSNVANVQFNQVSGIYNSDLRYFNVNAGEMLKLTGDSTTLGLHEVPDGGAQTPLYGMFNKQGAGWTLAGLKQGGFGFLTLIHEIGHGLGLAHPHDGNTIFPGVTSGFGSLGDNNLNQGIWTVMSYNDGWIEVPTPTPVLSYGQAGTPMAFDIATIQYIYGANTTYKTGNDTYLLPTSNVSGTYWSCIWDAGGIDTISAATSRVSAEINLNAAPLIGPNAAGFVSHVGKTINGSAIVGGFTIANNVVIENATGGSADDLLIGNQTNNLLLGNAGNDTIYGNAGNDTLDGGIGVDTLVGGTGDDTYLVDIRAVGISPNISSELQDVITENAGEGTADTLRLRGSVLIPVAITASEIALTGALANIENLDISLTGTTRLNITGNVENNILTGNAANNNLTGGFGNDTLDGGLGADNMNGGDGDDTYFVDVIRPTTGTGGDVITDSDGTDTVKTTFSATLTSDQFLGIENLTLLGTAALNATGNGEANELIGNDGANVIDGGAGADDMDGGKGNDTYIVDNDGDEVSELFTAAQGGGVDLVKSNVSFELDENIENLTLLNVSARPSVLNNINGTGNTLNNIITGNAGDNVLNGNEGNDNLLGGDGADTLTGGAGVDLLTGGKGDDTYNIDLIRISALATSIVALQDTVSELPSTVEGIEDTINLTNLTGNLGAPIDTTNITNATTLFVNAGIENFNASQTGSIKLNITGNALDNVITGNDADNILLDSTGNDTLNGGAGNDTLDGGVGVDTLVGGTGNDTYLVDIIPTLTTVAPIVVTGAQLQDVITETSGTTNGIDTLRLRGSVVIPATTAAQDIVLTDALANIENLDISATGVSRLNITGNAENNILTGNAANNNLTGGFGNDKLDGGAGADLMIGGSGDDIYIVDNISDVVTEAFDQGLDVVKASINYILGADIENLELTGATAINGTGNTLNNLITGNAAANILNGGLGNDNLIGGKGNDTYIVDNTLDDVTELFNDGIDLVRASVDFTLADNVENLTLTDGSANGGVANINGTGNALNNIITGNVGDNELDGSAGVDRLIGGLGDDTYIVDLIETGTAVALKRVALQDTVVEGANAGSDTLQLRGNFGHINATTLALATALENLDASATDATKLNLTGNTLNNIITGNDAANILLGGAGNDTLYGNAGNDTLDGGAGIDTLIGGLDDDTYVLDLKVSGTGIAGNINTFDDIITENNSTAEGHDTIKLRGSANLTNTSTLVLSGNWANLENLDASATGSTKLNITGNDEDNTLIGNATANTMTGGLGNDTLNGGAGADVMIGGSGDDIYIVDNIGDVVTEAFEQGLDVVKASINYILGADIENLELTGAAAINGTGNDLNNGIVGNTAANTLKGGAGDDLLEGVAGNDTLNGGADDDKLIGGSGNDILTGGIGADTFVWNLADKGTNGRPAIDRITDFKIGEPNIVEDRLDLRDILVGESEGNISNFLDITTSTAAGITSTEIKISNTGGFTEGTFSAKAENQRITLAGVNLLEGTNETDLLHSLIDQNKLIIDL